MIQRDSAANWSKNGHFLSVCADFNLWKPIVPTIFSISTSDDEKDPFELKNFQ